jgi:hypothetical protein
MRSSIYALALGALAAASCQKGDLVVVSVTSSAAMSIATLHVSATSGTKTSTFDVAVPGGRVPPTLTFAIDVSSGYHGTFSVALTAEDSHGKTLASAGGSAMLVPGGRSDIPICFGCGTHNVGGGGSVGDLGGGNAGDLGGAGNGGDGGRLGDGGSDGGTSCVAQTLALTKKATPDLLIIQDRSGSMADPPQSGSPVGTPSKWVDLSTGVPQATNAIGTVDWGLLFFTPVSGNGMTCAVPATPDVPCGAGTAAKISTAFAATSPNGGTPTTEAINAGMMYFQGTNDGNAHYMVIATDGLPACDTSDDSSAAEAAVTNAANAGIKTVVVGIGDDPTGDATLNVMAMNGGMPQTGGASSYYQVNSAADVEMVLMNVVKLILACDYVLPMTPADPSAVTIQDNQGQTIPRDTTHANGWDFSVGGSVQFYGGACTNLQSGATTSVSVVYGCGP